MAINTERQPAIFIPHGGGPCFFMDWTWGPADTWLKTRRFLEGLAATLPATPKAILVVSGHWEEPAFTASTAAQPKLIFDYSGFPEHTYRLTWPAPGQPELAARVASLLADAGLPSALSANRGYDHGVFVPLKVAFPAAEIPVVTLSLASQPRSRAPSRRRTRAGPVARRGRAHRRQRHELPQPPRLPPARYNRAGPRLRRMADRCRRVLCAPARHAAHGLAPGALCCLRPSPRRASRPALRSRRSRRGGPRPAHLHRRAHGRGHQRLQLPGVAPRTESVPRANPARACV